MSLLNVGKFHPMPRVSTAMPRGWERPAFCPGLPSQAIVQMSACDAAFRGLPSGSCWRLTSKRFAVASPRGTFAAAGQLALSVGSPEFQIGSTCSPCWVVPFGSKKKAPVMSPAHSKPAALSTMPAAWSPELNTYCWGEPLGQKPPPIVEDPDESTQTSPVAERPQ